MAADFFNLETLTALIDTEMRSRIKSMLSIAAPNVENRREVCDAVSLAYNTVGYPPLFKTELLDLACGSRYLDSARNIKTDFDEMLRNCSRQLVIDLVERLSAKWQETPQIGSDRVSNDVLRPRLNEGFPA